MKRDKRPKELKYLLVHGRYLIILSLGVTIGMFLALLNRNEQALFYSLYYMLSSDTNEAFMQIFIDSFIQYSLCCTVIGVCGMYKQMQYIQYFFIGCIGCIYGFTATCILLLLGMKGIFVAVGSFVVQMAIITYLSSMNTRGMRKRQMLVRVGIFAVGLSLYNISIQVIIERCMRYLLSF